jgi:hypothetical protein
MSTQLEILASDDRKRFTDDDRAEQVGQRIVGHGSPKLCLYREHTKECSEGANIVIPKICSYPLAAIRNR